jgi:hypoxanthine phosphoribosyltransferase
MEKPIPAFYNDCAYTLVSAEEISEMVDRLADEINATYENSPYPLVMVVILKGSMPFATDLMKRLAMPIELEFMKVSSYGAGTKSSGEIKISLDLKRDDLQNIDLLVVEDIVDSGRTLSRLTQLLKNRNAHSVRTCTLLDKPSRREVEFVPDFCGATIPDEFVIGFGLDYDEKYRNLPFVGVLKREVYEK